MWMFLQRPRCGMSARNIISERHHRSGRSVALRAAIAVTLVTACGASAQAQVLADFKNRDAVREWTVVSDAQFPGASGQVSSADGLRGGALRLDFDFDSGGGQLRRALDRGGEEAHACRSRRSAVALGAMHRV